MPGARSLRRWIGPGWRAADQPFAHGMRHAVADGNPKPDMGEPSADQSESVNMALVRIRVEAPPAISADTLVPLARRLRIAPRAGPSSLMKALEAPAAQRSPECSKVTPSVIRRNFPWALR